MWDNAFPYCLDYLDLLTLRWDICILRDHEIFFQKVLKKVTFSNSKWSDGVIIF